MRRQTETLDYPLSITDRFPQLKEIILKGRVPKHLCIIPDGNGRFAKETEGENAPAIVGHIAGAKKALEILRELRELPIKCVTVWAFSDNNWERGEPEVSSLMQLFDKMVKANLEEMKRDNVRFIHLGSKDRIPAYLLETLNKAEEETRENTGQFLSLAIDFGGADQELRIADKLRSIPLEAVTTTPKLLQVLRDGGGLIPPADLIIRTKERRLSGIGWIGDGKQTELCVIDKYFPEIETADIVDGIIDYALREQRFGGRPGNSKQSLMI